ncbi:MAG: hypothetical protein QXZ44_02945, partial [Ferroplasma sp.]
LECDTEMPVKKEEFNSGKKEDVKQLLLNFLKKNDENAYTLKELGENLGIDTFILHMDLTALLWNDEMEYRDIYDHDGKLQRYYSIKK